MPDLTRTQRNLEIIADALAAPGGRGQYLLVCIMADGVEHPVRYSDDLESLLDERDARRKESPWLYLVEDTDDAERGFLDWEDV